MDVKKALVGIGTFILDAVGIVDFSMMNSESTSSLSSLSDDELQTKREKVRLDYCSSGNSFEKAVQLEKELDRFDNEMRRRANERFEKEHPNGVPDAHWTDENRWD